MARLESLLHECLTGSAELSGKLSSFNGRPAVFELIAPPDTDPGWGGKQTPRVLYQAARQEDPERGIDGELTIAIIDAGQEMALPAELDLLVRRLLDGATFRADEGTVSLRWRRSDLFHEAGGLRGVKTVYDLIAWPAGLTYVPDPVAALRSWSITAYPGLQVDPTTWTPNDLNPALYWRLASFDKVEPTNWGAWVTVRLQGHLLAASPDTRLAWSRRVLEELATVVRLQLSDGSPLFVLFLGASGDADPLRMGQLRLAARFGVLRQPHLVPGELIRNAQMTQIQR